MTERRIKTLRRVIFFAEIAKLIYYKKGFKKELLSEGCSRENGSVMLSAKLQKGKILLTHQHTGHGKEK